MEKIDVRGVAVYPGLLDVAAQEAIVGAIRDVVRAAPFFRPVTRFGKALSVRMTAAGDFGWISDRRGYRYEALHPTGVAWPPIPAEVLAAWRDVTGLSRQPECCLVNYYEGKARMGLHQDRDEADFDWPVVSISLGDDALFRVGNVEKGGRTESCWLKSGDVAVLGGSGAACLSRGSTACERVRRVC